MIFKLLETKSIINVHYNINIWYILYIEKRKKWAGSARSSYPNKLPLIIERAPDQLRINELDNPK